MLAEDFCKGNAVGSGQDRSPQHMLKLHTNIENAGRTRCPLSHMTGLSQYFTPGIMQKPKATPHNSRLAA